MKTSEIAIIGIGGKYPKADSPDELWEHLVANTNLCTDGPQDATKQNYVSKYFALNRIGHFDHKKFKFTPLEARLTDPQHRILLTCVYQALIGAGYPNEPPNARFGVFTTTSLSSYLLNVLLDSEHYEKGEISYPILIGNDKDYLSTKIAYKLNFTGPALTIQCACSSSLVAMHHACQSLLSQECDLTIVGGVSISIPQEQGYFYKEGGILSPDGFCRPFDESANGTIKGNGCSVIILKRLIDAERDGDKIYALVKGTAINNDGANKVGFTAPSIQGQIACIQKALSLAKLLPEQIDFIETHGTGTQLGDLIELAALHQVFQNIQKKIPLGSLKADLGHLDVAAGLSSVIKLVYVLRNGIVPRLKHFQKLNPPLKEFSHPFDFPREIIKANLINVAVSSFGIGGTNAHAILSKYEPKNPRSFRIQMDSLCETEFWVAKENKTPLNVEKNVLSQIIDIWIKAIGEKSIHPESNFAELGGNSLIALEIVHDMKKRFSFEFDLSQFKLDITPLKLTAHVMQQKHETSLFIQAKKATFNPKSIFLLHPAGGTIFCYYLLCQVLKGDYNIFVIDLPPNYSNFPTMEKLGEYYLKEIRKCQTEGPFWLGGYSFGGNLAYEIAVQLETMGKSVEKVILFDSHLPEAYTSLPPMKIQYQAVFWKLLNYFENKEEIKQVAMDQFYTKWIYSHQLLKSHQQEKKISADITLFAAQEEEDCSILELLNIANLSKEHWQSRTLGQFKKFRVPGDHYTMFENPHHLSTFFDEELS